MMYGWDWGGWIVITVVMVLFWAAVITAIVLAVRYLAGGVGQRSQGGDRLTRTPEDVLAERFARGDIDEEEYRRRMLLLREHR
ncbi:SHOCT domain-containing protein [Mycobacterium sp.]|uniref:SHOCT domain-containing protein n=1 Tax=Mycobacterium sp. TaxID=1785 RepID=UPI003C76EACF